MGMRFLHALFGALLGGVAVFLVGLFCDYAFEWHAIGVGAAAGAALAFVLGAWFLWLLAEVVSWL